MKFPIHASAGIILTLASFGLVSTASAASAAGHSLAAGPPKFYVEAGRGAKGIADGPISVRARATGAVTGTVSCPQPLQATNFTAAGGQVFFLQCGRFTPGSPYRAKETRLFRFTVTADGHATGYALVRGGTFNGDIYGLSASANGKVLAFDFEARATAQDKIVVINVKNGVRASWAEGVMPGGEIFTGQQTSLTANGRELAVFGPAHCPKGGQAGSCKSPGEEMRVVSPALAGGKLARGRQVFRQAQLIDPKLGFINQAAITPDGSDVTAAIVVEQGTGNTAEVLSVSAATGKPRKVLFKLKTGNGGFFDFLGADPSGQWLLAVAGPDDNPVNGWIDNGKLVRLKPDGETVKQEAWSS